MKKNHIVIYLTLVVLLVTGLVILTFFYPKESKFVFLTISLSVLLGLFGYSTTKKWYILFVTTLIAIGFSFFVWIVARNSIIPITLFIFLIDVFLLGLYLALNKDTKQLDSIKYNINALPSNVV